MTGDAFLRQPVQGGLNIADRANIVKGYDACPADKATDFGDTKVFYCPACGVQVWDESRLESDRDPYCMKRREAALAKRR